MWWHQQNSILFKIWPTAKKCFNEERKKIKVNEVETCFLHKKSKCNIDLTTRQNF